MDRQVLIRDLKAYVDGAGFINTSQLAKYMKRSRDSIADMVNGLEYLDTGRAKQYFIPDVATRILDQRR